MRDMKGILGADQEEGLRLRHRETGDMIAFARKTDST